MEAADVIVRKLKIVGGEVERAELVSECAALGITSRAANRAIYRLESDGLIERAEFGNRFFDPRI
jgi:DNA-binding transcriptional regulator PaaX